MAFDVRNTTGTRDSNSRNQDTNHLNIREKIKLGGKGWIYHPKALKFSGTLGLAFEQGSQDYGNGAADTDETEFDGSLRLSFLPDKAVPVNVSIDQAVTEVTPPFGAVETVTSGAYGVQLGYGKLKFRGLAFPVNVEFRHMDVERESGSSTTERATDKIDFRITNRTEHTRSRLRYDWRSSDVASVSSDVGTIERQNLRFVNNYTGDGRRVYLDTDFSWTESTIGEDLPTTSMFLVETLHLRFGENVETRLRYGLTSQETDAIETTHHRLNFTASHHLYESLSSSLGLNGSLNDSELGNSTTMGGGVSFAYKKRIPHGTVEVRLAPNYISHNQENVASGVESILSENLAVSVGPLLFLGNANVLPATISVYDLGTPINFNEGVDYDLIVVGDRVALQVIPGSQLDPGVAPLLLSVQVDYDYQAFGERTSTTMTIDSGFTVDLWEHFNFSVDYTMQDHDVDQDQQAQELILTESNHLQAKIHLRFPHNETRMLYSQYEDNLLPRSSYSLTHRFNYRITPKMNFVAGGGYHHQEVDSLGTASDAYDVHMSSSMLLPGRIGARVNLGYRMVDQVASSSSSLRAGLKLTYRYRRIGLELEERIRLTDSTQSSGGDTDSFENMIYFKIWRSF